MVSWFLLSLDIYFCTAADRRLAVSKDNRFEMPELVTGKDLRLGEEEEGDLADLKADELEGMKPVEIKEL